MAEDGLSGWRRVVLRHALPRRLFLALGAAAAALASLGRDAAVQDSRLASLEAERGQLDREAALLARRESLAEADFERFRLLEARGFVVLLLDA